MKPEKHGRDHLPGGEDPIPLTIGAPTAIATSAGLHSMSLTGTDVITFRDLWATANGPFTYSGSNPFNDILITQDGCYRAIFYINWSTSFTTTEFPYIEPWCNIDGTPDSLVNFESDPFFYPVFEDTQSWIGGEQLGVSSEVAHKSVQAEFIFNLSFSVAGISTFGIRNVLRSGFAGTKSVAGKVAVTRLCDYLTEIA